LAPVNGAAVESDSSVAEQIMRRYAAMVFRVCYSVTQSAHDAEDATQAVFLSLLEQTRTGQPISNIGAWLHKVAYRVSLDIRRNKKRRLFRERIHGGRIHTQQTDAMLRCDDLDESKAIVAEELNKLPAKYRLPLILHYFGGLSQEEMARELHCRTGALRVRLFRAREMLGKLLSDRGFNMASLATQATLEQIVHSAVTESIIAATRGAAVNGLRIGVAASAPPAAYSLGLKLAAVFGLLAAPAIPTAIRPLIRATWPSDSDPAAVAFSQWSPSESTSTRQVLLTPADVAISTAYSPQRLSAPSQSMSIAGGIPLLHLARATSTGSPPQFQPVAPIANDLPFLRTGPMLVDWTAPIASTPARLEFARSLSAGAAATSSSQSTTIPQLAGSSDSAAPSSATASAAEPTDAATTTSKHSSSEPKPVVPIDLTSPAIESGSNSPYMVDVNGNWEAFYFTSSGEFTLPDGQEYQVTTGANGEVEVSSVSVPEPAGLALLAGGVLLLKRKARQRISN
jgi:RNA polymerase sigma factor (sigma-70 family)